MAFRQAARLRKGAGDFERPFPGFGAAVTKKHAIESGYLGQHLRQLSLILVKKQIRNMKQPVRLALDHRQNRWVAMAERVHSNATQKIQIAPALGIPEMHATPANKQNWLALIGGKQKLGFQTRDRSKAHARRTSVPHSIFSK